ncbi:hypothetical protein ZWY2020_049569 [Hordeum vulgare]|nr:hypothetical protein ZWY2020_049569 [Hordeum vulgare]
MRTGHRRRSRPPANRLALALRPPGLLLLPGLHGPGDLVDGDEAVGVAELQRVPGLEQLHPRQPHRAAPRLARVLGDAEVTKRDVVAGVSAHDLGGAGGPVEPLHPPGCCTTTVASSAAWRCPFPGLPVSRRGRVGRRARIGGRAAAAVEAGNDAADLWGRRAVGGDRVVLTTEVTVHATARPLLSSLDSGWVSRAGLGVAGSVSLGVLVSSRCLSSSWLEWSSTARHITPLR